MATRFQRLARVDPIGAADSRGAAQRIDTLGIALGGIIEVILEHGSEVVPMLFGFGADDALLTGQAGMTL